MQETLMIKGKNVGYIKMKNICLSKDTTEIVEDEEAEQEKKT